ncbi:hypothetical protein AAC387_Pa03g4461 [Persea americana]
MTVTGFLSIDCGIAEDLNYTDDKTKIFYTSYAKFMDTGTNKQISEDYMFQTLPRQYQNVRFFPDGSRNCYTLSPVVKRSRSIIEDHLAVDTYVDVELWCAISAVIVSIPHMDSEEILGSFGDFTQVVTVAASIREAFNITIELSKCSSRHESL